jgi:hypothetical protein
MFLDATRVVREYELLLNGGDPYPPELKAECTAIAATYPPFTEQRNRELNDPWWRAIDKLRPMIADYYDPDNLKRCITIYRENDNPFSACALETQEFIDALDSLKSPKDGSARFN